MAHRYSQTYCLPFTSQSDMKYQFPIIRMMSIVKIPPLVEQPYCHTAECTPNWYRVT